MSKRKQNRKQGKSVEERLRVLGAHVEGFRSWLRHNGYRPRSWSWCASLPAGPSGYQRPGSPSTSTIF